MKKRSPATSRFRSRGSLATPRRGQLSRVKSRRAPTAKLRSSARSGRTRRSARATTDHEEIRRWVEARGGHPALVKRTARGEPESGIIRVDFPGFSGARSLKPISWDEWFDIFEQRGLAFLRQERTAGGKPSRFNKLVARE